MTTAFPPRPARHERNGLANGCASSDWASLCVSEKTDTRLFGNTETLWRRKRRQVGASAPSLARWRDCRSQQFQHPL